MSDYKVPLRDFKFTLSEVLGMEEHYAKFPAYHSVNDELVDAILSEASRFIENEVAPLYRVGDIEGCRLENGVVKTPTGFAEAYQKYVDGGWPALSGDSDHGGQGLPESIRYITSEINAGANWSWGMYSGLSHGAINTIERYGTEEQKLLFLSKLNCGEWTATMCLTESHCGTDLGLLRTKAAQNSDGSYAISGTKIFISGGDHDITDNIVHIVLARIEGAAEGTRGISLFIVPKVLVSPDGSLGERNEVNCGSLEQKHGIHGISTCVMNFDGAKGYLLGEANRGLKCMFTFMNMARIGTAIQGIGHAERGFQGALAYARDRLQSRALTGPSAPDKPADPIIVHPDVRRMLLTQKAIAEGGRGLVYYTTQLVDILNASVDEEARKDADAQLSVLTPVAKAFLTELGYEAASYGMQVLGGHGYIAEWGMEQNLRDARISMLYEGTTGIQALDLLGRKVLPTQGSSLRVFTQVIENFCQKNADDPHMAEFVNPLSALTDEWAELTVKIGQEARKNMNVVGSASVDYTMYSGYISLAYIWARYAAVAKTQLAASTHEKAFYDAKIKTAQFYFKKILPRTRGLVATMMAEPSSVMALDEAAFAF